MPSKHVPMNTRPLQFLRRGQPMALANVPPDRTLLEVLREDLGHTGVAQVLPQHLQQRAVGWYIGQRHGLAPAQKLQWAGVHGHVLARHPKEEDSSEGMASGAARHKHKLMTSMHAPL